MKQLTTTIEDRIEECRQFCLNLTEDKELREILMKAPFEDLVEFLLINGFEYEIKEVPND